MEIKKISEVEWEIKDSSMPVPGRIFASEKLIEKIKQDKTLEQVKNAALLPGVIKNSIALPDAHQGYGLPIGGVIAFDAETGIISPGAVGFDINCSVRLLRTNLTRKDIEGKEKVFTKALFKAVPVGVGGKGKLILKQKEIDQVLIKGAGWCLENNYATKEDIEFIEEKGCLSNANPKDVTGKAKGRGIPQLGTLGAGNHFVEMQYVGEIFDDKIAKVFGLEKDQIVLMIHCGSRGLGHQVASDYINLMGEKYGFPETDKDLVYAPIKSELGQKYLSAMACAANFAFANKQLLTHQIREEIKKLFPKFKAEVVYDICHNIAKFEKNQGKEILIIRKGATRSFGPGRKEIPEKYRKVGQPILIPGSMGTSSWVLVGTNKAEEVSFSSTAHGAGRVSSRAYANKNLDANRIKKELEKQGIVIESASKKGIVEEAPEVYKDVDEVVMTSHKAGIGNLVAKLKPIGVVKG